MNNQIGFTGYSTQQATIENNTLYNNTLAGITLVDSDNGVITLNNITKSGNGLYLDHESNNNDITFNNFHSKTIDIITLMDYQ